MRFSAGFLMEAAQEHSKEASDRGVRVFVETSSHRRDQRR